MGPRRQRKEQRNGESAYELYNKGLDLLKHGDNAQAALPLERAKSLEPNKSSIREALGRAYFLSGSYKLAAREFEAVTSTHPTNDYAHFCLGRSLQKLGSRRQARKHISLASHMRPDRKDYRDYMRKLSR